MTRKNVNALSDRDLGKKFQSTYDRFAQEYKALETQYADGIDDHRVWANDLKNLAQDLMKKATQP